MTLVRETLQGWASVRLCSHNPPAGLLKQSSTVSERVFECYRQTNPKWRHRYCLGRPSGVSEAVGVFARLINITVSDVQCSRVHQHARLTLCLHSPVLYRGWRHAAASLMLKVTCLFVCLFPRLHDLMVFRFVGKNMTLQRDCTCFERVYDVQWCFATWWKWLICSLRVFDELTWLVPDSYFLKLCPLLLLDQGTRELSIFLPYEV